MPALDFWTAYWTFVSFVFGAIVGSFLNVCIWRLPRDESLGHPPSHCPSCNHVLRFVPDMIPLFSQLRTRSRCRYCGAPYSWRYFWVELITAVLFAGLYLRLVVFTDVPLGETERTLSAMCAMAFAAAMVTIFFIDLDCYQIYNLPIYIAIGAGVLKDLNMVWHQARPLSAPVLGLLPLPLSVLTGLMAFWLLWQFGTLASAILGKEAMGAGDYYLLGAMGTMLVPWPLLVFGFLVAVSLGSLVGLAAIYIPSRQPAPAVAPETPDSGPVSTAALEYALARGMADPVGPEAAASPEPAMAGSESRAGGEEGAHRGAVNLGEAHPDGAPEADGAPLYPAGSRWGRAWTLVGNWIAAGTVCYVASVYRTNLASALAVGAVGGLAAAGFLTYGIRLWKRSDQSVEVEMDEFLADDPGPRFIPFGPYLVTGALIAMFIGRPILEWYLVQSLGFTPAALAGMGWD